MNGTEEKTVAGDMELLRRLKDSIEETLSLLRELAHRTKGQDVEPYYDRAIGDLEGVFNQLNKKTDEAPGDRPV